MRIDPGNIDKFAQLFKAGKKPAGKSARRGKVTQPEKKEARPSPNHHPYTDEEGVPFVRPYKTQRERQIEAIEYEKRRFKAYLAKQQRRRDRIASEVQGARRWFKTIERIERERDANVIGYLDVDVDLAGLARSLQLASIPVDADRFACLECALEMVRSLAKGTEYAVPDIDTLFEPSSVTAIDELRSELRLR